MRSRKGDLTLLVIGFLLACARVAGAAGPGALAFPGQDAPPLELTPAEGEIAYSEKQFLPGQFADSACPEGPMWYFQVEGLALRRDASGDQPWQHVVVRTWTDTAAPGDPPNWVSTDSDRVVLSTNDLDFGFQGGGRATIGRKLGDYHAFEATYFQVTDWDEMATVTPSGAPLYENPQGTFNEATLLSPFTHFLLPPVDGLDDNKLAKITYSSSLSNIEWNLRRWLPMPYQPLQVSVLVGGRYMNIGENFFYYTESDVPAGDPATNSVTADTQNTMLGVQIGALFEFHVEPAWWIGCEIKGAVFNNAASQDTEYVHTGGGTPAANTYTQRHEEQTSAFALDLRLSATLQVTECLAVHGGYDAIWVDGLVLASDNLSQDVDILTSGPATLVDKGRTVYHGPHLGVSWTW